MKHLQGFNELKSSTYYSAADKLSKLSHVKRSSDIKSWGAKAEDEERSEREKQERLKWSNSGVYDIKVFKSLWLAGGRKESDLMQGKFHVSFDYERDMFSDQYWHWSESDYDFSLYLSLSIGILPADEETSSEFRSMSDINDNISGNVLYPQWLMIKLAKPGDVSITFPQDVSIDSIDSLRFSLSSRGESLKFKKFLVSELSGTSNITGIKDRIEKHIDLIKTYPTYKRDIPDNFMDKLVNSANRMSLNILYKE